MQILKNVASVAKKFTKKSRISAVCRPCDKSTTVKAIKVADNGTEVKDGHLTSGTKYELSLDWLDQYGNPIAGTANDKATWSVTPATMADLKDTSDNALTGAASAVHLTPNLDVTSGNLTVTAYYGSDKKVQSEFQVSAPDLTDIAVTNKGFKHLKSDKTYTALVTDGTDLYSKEELTSDNITAVPTGAQLNPDDLKTVVTAIDELGAEIDLTKDENKPDVKIVKAKKMDTTVTPNTETAEELVNTLQVKLTPAVPGRYTVKLYSKDADVTKDNPLDELTTGLVKNNPKLKTIKLVDAFNDNEVTAGGDSGYKKVEFINVNDEPIDVLTTGLTATTSGTVSAVTLHGEDTDGNPIKTPISDSTTPVKYVKVTGGAEAGKGGFTLQANAPYGTEFLNVEVNVVATAKVDKVAFTKTESTVQPIAQDTASDTTANKFEVASGYTLVPVVFKNQYGGDFEVKAKQSNSTVILDGVTAKFGTETIAGADTSGEFSPSTQSNLSEYKLAFFDEDKTLITYTNALSTPVVKYIGVYAGEDMDKEPAVTLSLSKDDTSTTASTDSITVKAREARALKTITLDQKTSTISAGATITYEVAAKDQYGKAWELKREGQIASSDNLTIADVDTLINSNKVISANGTTYYDDDKATADASNEYGYSVAYYNASEAKITEADGVVKYIKVTAGSDTTAPKSATAKLSLNGAGTKIFDSADINYVATGDVDKIDIADKEVKANTTPHDERTYRNGTVFLYKPADGVTVNKFEIPVTAYDANGKAVVVTSDFYNAGTVTIKDKDGVVKYTTDENNYATAAINSTTGKLMITLKQSVTNTMVEGDTVTINLTSKTGLTDTLTFKVGLSTPELKTDIKVVNVAAPADDNGAYPEVTTDGISAITTYKDDDGNDVATLTKLSIQGVDQYGVLRNTTEDHILEDTVYYSTKQDIAGIERDGSIIPYKVGSTVIRFTPYDVAPVTVTVPQLKAATASDTGTHSESNKITISDLKDGMHYVLIDTKTGKAAKADGDADGSSDFVFGSGSGANNQYYYLFEVDASGNIIGYGVHVQVGTIS